MKNDQDTPDYFSVVKNWPNVLISQVGAISYIRLHDKIHIYFKYTFSCKNTQ